VLCPKRVFVFSGKRTRCFAAAVGGVRKNRTPDTPPLARVLPGTGGPRQYPFRNKDLRKAGTGQYLARSLAL